MQMLALVMFEMDAIKYLSLRYAYVFMSLFYQDLLVTNFVPGTQ